jgi:hypothetical protein
VVWVGGERGEVGGKHSLSRDTDVGQLGK